MSNRQESQVRTIHPRAIKGLGEEACIVALGVARDLRSGVIPAEKFNMGVFCGTACCIAGHIAGRLGVPVFKLLESLLDQPSGSYLDLFSSRHPSDPYLAADAIERSIYGGSETAWTP